MNELVNPGESFCVTKWFENTVILYKQLESMWWALKVLDNENILYCFSSFKIWKYSRFKGYFNYNYQSSDIIQYVYDSIKKKNSLTLSYA